MIYKLYLIEIIGNFPILFGLFSVMIVILSLCLLSKYDNDMRKVFYREDEDVIKTKFKKRVITLLYSLIICLSISVLTPSKTFMYSATGIHETLKFIKGNKEVKKISKKAIQIIDKKLDNLINDEK